MLNQITQDKRISQIKSMLRNREGYCQQPFAICRFSDFIGSRVSNFLRPTFLSLMPEGHTSELASFPSVKFTARCNSGLASDLELCKEMRLRKEVPRLRLPQVRLRALICQGFGTPTSVCSPPLPKKQSRLCSQHTWSYRHHQEELLTSSRGATNQIKTSTFTYTMVKSTVHT